MPADYTLHGLDLAVIGAYLALLAGIGVYFARRSATAEGYFVGHRAFPGWAVGLSMFATSISSVTFLAFPGAAYVLDWRQVVPNLVLPVIIVLAILVFIPFFRRGALTSAFEYLEDRFGPLLRLAGAVIFMLMQFVRLGTVLYLVSIPLQIATGLDSTWAILIAGVVVAFYTVAGGLEAVIWIDVIQGTVLILGAISPLVCILYAIPGGLPEVLSVGMEHGKFGLGGLNWNLAERTLPVLLLIGLLNWTSEYTTNQNVVQRYLAASSLREARKAALICGLMSVPIWIFFFFVGTSLFAYYRVFPDPVVNDLVASRRADWIFPHFIATKMPVGLAGLVIAGLLSATMALDSSINSVATISTVDIIKRHLCPGRDDAFYLKMGRIMSFGAAVIMIGGAMIFTRVPKESMVDLGLIIAAVLFGGGVPGVFLIGFLTTRVDYASATVAFVLAVLFDAYLVLCNLGAMPEFMRVNVHWYWIGILANLVFAVAAYGLSFLLPEVSRHGVGPEWLRTITTDHRRKSLHRLTIWTMRDAPAAPGS